MKQNKLLEKKVKFPIGKSKQRQYKKKIKKKKAERKQIQK